MLFFSIYSINKQPDIICCKYIAYTFSLWGLSLVDNCVLLSSMNMFCYLLCVLKVNLILSRSSAVIGRPGCTCQLWEARWSALANHSPGLWPLTANGGPSIWSDTVNVGHLSTQIDTEKRRLETSFGRGCGIFISPWPTYFSRSDWFGLSATRSPISRYPYSEERSMFWKDEHTSSAVVSTKFSDGFDGALIVSPSVSTKAGGVLWGSGVTFFFL